MQGRGLCVILLGPPGVGKGTQGVLLADALGWERLVTGDLLRAARRDGTELGRQAQGFMDAGNLVPDELMVALVEERLDQLPAARGVIFDGFPRTAAQAEALRGAGRSVDVVVLLEAADDVLVRRISGRRSCGACGRVYNVHFDPPASEDACDACGAALIHRGDDTPETVAHRLRVYREQTQPLVDYYESRVAVPVLRVDGEGRPEVVRAAVEAAVASQFGVGARKGT